MRHLARIVVGHPWLVVLAWLVGVSAITIWGPAFGDAPHSSLGLPAGTETARANAFEAAHFGAGTAPTATVVTEDAAGADQLRSWLVSAPDVAQVGTPVPSRDGQAALIPLAFARGGAALDAAIGGIEDHLAADHAAMTGDAVANHDFNAAALGSSSGASATSPLRIVTLLIVIAVLALVYRAPLAVLVPLLCVGAAILVSPHLVGLVGSLLHLPVSDFSLLFMFSVTLGAGTNYGLFLISRYREALAGGLAPRPALEQALTHVGEAVTASAATVVVAAALMALASFDLFKTLGPPVAVAVATMLLAGLTLLPALLAICGRALFWPRRQHAGQAAEHGLWRRAGELVVRHPAWLAGVTALVLVPAAVAGVATPLSFDLTSGLPDTTSIARAGTMLARHFPEQENGITLLVEAPGDGEAVRSAVAAVPGVAAVGPAQTSPDGGAQRYRVGLRDDPSSQAAAGTVAAVERAAVQTSGGRALASGAAVANRDFRDLLGADFRLVAALVAGSILVILAVLLRSAVAPIYLLATVGLSTAAAIGVAGLVSQRLLGQPLFWTAPVFGFVFLVALGEDFNIFLMSRLRREVAAYGRPEGTARAVGATGGVITSCGLVMASAFLLLVRSPLVVAQQIGLVVVIGVLLDTFLVRPLLVPALSVLLGSGPARTAGAERPAYDRAG
jgi:RND superfamily putative drug exporter